MDSGFPAHLFLPLFSSFLYVGSVLLIKRAEFLGTDAWRATFVANEIGLLFFLPLLFFAGDMPPLIEFWKPLVTGALLMSGQTFTFLALQRGNVSIATPVMGMKMVFVAVFTVVALGLDVPLKIWVAAGLSVAGIAILHSGRGSGAVGRTIMLSLIAAASFALFDVLVQKWSPAWGAGWFLPATALALAIYSFGVIPLFREPLRALPRKAWPSLAGSAVLMSIQALALIGCVAVFQDAARINVVYGSRGLWSVIAVWLFGARIGTRESNLGLRLVGAGFMFTALVLVVL